MPCRDILVGFCRTCGVRTAKHLLCVLILKNTMFFHLALVQELFVFPIIGDSLQLTGSFGSSTSFVCSISCIASESQIRSSTKRTILSWTVSFHIGYYRLWHQRFPFSFLLFFFAENALYHCAADTFGIQYVGTCTADSIHLSGYSMRPLTFLPQLLILHKLSKERQKIKKTFVSIQLGVQKFCLCLLTFHKFYQF